MTRVRGSGLGFHFSITSSDGALLRFVRDAMVYLTPDPDWGEDEAAHIAVERNADALRLTVEDREIFTGASAPVLARLMNVINLGATRFAGGDPVLHCGVVSRGDRAVLLPGRPGAGKSTTTTALLARGFGYLSDEAAPVRPDLRIRPYPKPVVVGRGSWPSVSEARRAVIELEGDDLDVWWLDPGMLGDEVPPEPMRIGAVLAPQYRAGAMLSVEELTRAEATVVLTSNTFNMHQHGIDGVARVADAIEGIPLLRATFGDVGQVCDVLEEALS